MANILTPAASIVKAMRQKNAHDALTRMKNRTVRHLSAYAPTRLTRRPLGPSVSLRDRVVVRHLLSAVKYKESSRRHLESTTGKD